MLNKTLKSEQNSQTGLFEQFSEIHISEFTYQNSHIINSHFINKNKHENSNCKKDPDA